MIFGPALAAFRTENMPQGYALLNEATSLSGVKVLEGVALSSGGFFFLLNGEKKDLAQAYGLVTKSQRSNHLYIDEVHPEILPAIYAQNRFQVKDIVGSISSPCPVSALDAAQKLLQGTGLHLIDFRAFSGEPHFFITGDKAELEKTWAAIIPNLKKTQPESHFELIANPSIEFLKFFNL